MMKKNINKMFAGLAALTISIASITACTSKASNNTAEVSSGAAGKSSDSEKSASDSKAKSDLKAGSDTQSRDLSSIYASEDLDDSWDEADPVQITLNKDSALTSDDSAVAVEGSVITIKKAGVYVVSGELENGQILVDADEEAVVHIVLNGATLNSSVSAPIYASNAKKVILTLADGTENTLSDAAEYVYAEGEDEPDAALFVKNDLTINGSGTLNITANYADGIKAEGKLLIISGGFNIRAADNAVKGKDSITIEGGEFNIEAQGKGMTGEGALTVYNADIDITKSDEGLEGLTVEIYGGGINIVAGDDGINARVKYDDNISDEEKERLGMQYQESAWIKIASGSVSVCADGDGIDSNGDVYIEGGSLYLNGPEDEQNGGLDYNGSAVINGGLYIGVSSSGMSQGFSKASGQNSIEVFYAQTQAGGTAISLTDASGNEIAAITAMKTFSSLIISSPEIKAGETLTLKTGESSQEITVNEGVTTIGESKSGFPGGFGTEMPQPRGDFGGEPPKDSEGNMLPPDREPSGRE